MALDLSGVWKCDDRGLYFIRQDGTTIWWCGLSTDRTLPQYGLEFANVFTGTLDGLRLDGTWSDVPRGATEGHGSLSLSVIIDQDGGPRNLVKGSDTGGFSGANWTFVRLHFVPLAPTTAELFDLATKNIWASDVYERESLHDNLDVGRETAVVLTGRLRPLVETDNGHHWLVNCSFPVGEQPTAGAFWDMNDWWDAWLDQSDADSNFDVDVLEADLPDGFFAGVDDLDRQTIEANIEDSADGRKIRFHCEMIMYGRAHGDGNPYLPGWADNGGNSVLANGRPVEGDLVITPGHRVDSVAGHLPTEGRRLRVSGVLAFDHGHGEEGVGRGVEVHPVYAVDFIDARVTDDLSGAWATSDGGTCYVRQLYDDVWFFWSRPYRDFAYSTVFRGTRNGNQVSGEWIDVPYGDRTESGRLALTLDPGTLRFTPDRGSAFAGIVWEKLYDSAGLVCPPARVELATRPEATCQGIVVASVPLTVLARLVPHRPAGPVSWEAEGVEGTTTAAGDFLVGETPPRGTRFAVVATVTADDGCVYRNRISLTSGSIDDVDLALRICEIERELQRYLHSIYPPLPWIPPGTAGRFSSAQLRTIADLVGSLRDLTAQFEQGR